MLNNKKTIVLGASTNPSRYSYLAVKRLMQKNIPVIPISNKNGNINGIEMQPYFSDQENIHTVTLYISAEHQQEYYDYIFSLNPQRIIFNPGAENEELFELAQKKGIEVLEACTLVMSSTGQY